MLSHHSTRPSCQFICKSKWSKFNERTSLPGQNKKKSKLFQYNPKQYLTEHTLLNSVHKKFKQLGHQFTKQLCLKK